MHATVYDHSGLYSKLEITIKTVLWTSMPSGHSIILDITLFTSFEA